jgi:hypothetical protein
LTAKSAAAAGCIAPASASIPIPALMIFRI